MCPCMMNFVVPSTMQDIEQNQLPREMISRAKDCNDDPTNLIAHYRLVRRLQFDEKKKKNDKASTSR